MYRYHLTPQSYATWYKLHAAYWCGELVDGDFLQIALLIN